MIEVQIETNESTIIVGNFNSALSEMDWSSRQKISENIAELNSSANQLGITSIDYIQQQQSTHSSQVHIDHKLR